MEKSILSIVVPCYNEEAMIDLFYNDLIDKIKKLINENLDIELVFIDDGSDDNTLMKIKELSSKDSRIKYISFSRNFGKESAIYAGLKEASGDYIVLMDADLQHPPEIIVDMFENIKTREYDIIATRRDTRKGEPVIRSFFATIFYKFINAISDIKIKDGAMDFRMMTRQVADAILEFKEYNRFTKGLYSFVGFRTKWISIDNVERAGGKTKWSFMGLLAYSIDGVLALSVFPLTIISVLGVVVSFLSLIFIAQIIIEKLLYGNPTPGYPSTMALIGFMGGLQIFVLGIIGQYIAKIYLESKNRPIYIVKEKSK